jgi:hypothetical protein
MQVCIGLEADTADEVFLFFGEEYGFPAALYEAGCLHILYGNNDWLDHEWIISDNSKLLSGIALNVARYFNNTDKHGMATRRRYVCVGATNSLGHNLINDVSGLLELVKVSLLKGYDISLVSLESGFFDVIAASNIASLTGISYASLSQGSYVNYCYSDLPFFVRAFGYGFQNKEFSILTSNNKSFEKAKQIKRIEKILYISIRSRHEERHREQIYEKMLAIVLAELNTKNYNIVVFDGMTKIENDNALSLRPMGQHIDSQIKVASELKSNIEKYFPALKFVNLVNAKMECKIPYAIKSSAFIGPYGSGTWPLVFMKHGVAFILFQGDSSGLKTDPIFDYHGLQLNVRIRIVKS